MIDTDTTPHWPRRVGVEGVIEDQLQQAALSSQAWADVQTQLSAEGADSLKVVATKETFVTAFQSLVAPANGFGVDSGAALDAAKQLTIVGQTALGAVNTVTGLVHDLSSETPQQIMQSFTGGLVALAVGAGAISAGVGAAIVAGIGAIINVLQSAGLFSAPAGVQLQGCGSTYYNPPPTIAVGCLAGYCDPKVVQVSPSAGGNLWRSFPNPGNLSDHGWFQQGNASLGLWKGVNWGPTPQFQNQPRPVDVAFPNYAWIERGAMRQGSAPAVAPLVSGSAFLQGFASAWRANSEYALNGLQPQSDEQVLLHYLRIWNRAHGSPPAILYQGGYGSYAESLVTAALSKNREFDSGDGGLLVNTGSLQSPPATSAASSALVSTGAVSGGLSTGGKVAASVAIGGGVLLLGTAGYAAYTHQSIGQVWTRIAKKVRLRR